MKKILSCLAAIGVSLLSIMPVTSSADVNEFSNSSDVVSGWTEGFTALDEKYRPLYEWDYWSDWGYENIEIYINDDASQVRYIYPVDYEEETITLSDGVTVDQANAVLKETFKAFNLTPYLVEKGKLSDGTPCYEGVGSGDLHKIVCKHLKEKGMIGSYIVKTGFYEHDDFYFDRVLNYDQYSEEKMDEETFNEVASYIEDKNIGKLCPQDDVTDGDRGKMIMVYDNVTIAEQLDTALEIYEKYGLVPHGISPTMTDTFPIGGETIDLYNAVEGDANNDGDLDIADATLVLQSVGNADKYSLSAQGTYNADVDGNEGVTALDALEIQKIDAKLR